MRVAVEGRALTSCPGLRKQYHLRPLGGGLYTAWDVHRLIRLSCDLPVIAWPLADIRELDEPFWFHESPPTVRAVAQHAALMMAVNTSFPIVLCAQGRVMDGMHRVARAHNEGRSTLAAVRFAVTPEPDHAAVRLDALRYD